MIDVNHTLVYYDHRDTESKQGCYFNVHTPKTKAGVRQVPMLDFVKEAFLMEREYQREAGIQCKVVIDGYTDFIFVNREGGTYYQGTLNSYADVTKDLKKAEFAGLESFFKGQSALQPAAVPQ